MTDCLFNTPEERALFQRMTAQMLRSERVPALADRLRRSYIISNVVGSVSYGCRIDGTDVLKRHPSAYKPNFTSVVVRFGAPLCTMLLFPTGFAVLTNARSKEEYVYAAHVMRKEIVAMGYRAKLEHLSVDNIVASGLVPYPISVASYEDESCCVTYDPYVFPAAVFQIVDTDITVLLFNSGSFTMVGMSTPDEADYAYNHVSRVLAKHRCDDDADNDAAIGPKRRAQLREGKRGLVRAGAGRAGPTGAVSATATASRGMFYSLTKGQQTEFQRRLAIKLRTLRNEQRSSAIAGANTGTGAAQAQEQIINAELQRYLDEIERARAQQPPPLQPAEATATVTTTTTTTAMDIDGNAAALAPPPPTMRLTADASRALAALPAHVTSIDQVRHVLSHLE